MNESDGELNLLVTCNRYRQTPYSKSQPILHKCPRIRANMSGSTDHSLSDESACDFNTVFEKLCGESNTASLTSPQLFTERHQKESKIELADLHRAITEGKNVAIATSLETKAILEEFTSQHTMLDSMKSTVESNTKTLSTMRTDLITRIDKLDKNQKESLLQIAKAFKKVEVNTAQEGIKTRKHNAKTAKETQKKMKRNTEIPGM